MTEEPGAWVGMRARKTKTNGLPPRLRPADLRAQGRAPLASTSDPVELGGYPGDRWTRWLLGRTYSISWGSSAGWYTSDERDLDQVRDGALRVQGRRSEETVHVVAHGWPNDAEG